MMKDTFTGDLIIPDEADGCYRKLDIQTGELTGEICSLYAKILFASVTIF